MQTTTYRVAISDSSGCGVTDTAYRTVYVRPALQIQPIADTVYCRGAIAMLVPTGSGGDSMRYAWQWQQWASNRWNSLPARDTLRLNPATEGLFRVILRDSCTTLPDTLELRLHLRDSLKVAPRTDTTICIGQFVQLFATASGGDSAKHQYLWKDLRTQATYSGRVQSVNPDSTTIYRVILSDGCTTPADSAEVTIRVRPPLRLQPRSDTTICISQAVQLFATASVGDSFSYQYFWKNLSDNTTLSGQNQTVSPAVTTIYRVILSDACTTPDDSSDVTISVRPSLNVGIMADSACFTGATTLRASGTGGYPPQYRFSWALESDPGTTLHTGSEFVVSPPQRTRYRVTLSDACSQDTFAVIAVEPRPIARFTLSDTAGCSPLTIRVADSSKAEFGSVFRYNFGMQQIAREAGDFSVTLSTPGTFRPGMSITSPTGCSHIFISEQVITVYPLPVADFTAQPTHTSILEPLIRFFDASTRAVQWQWNFGDGSTSLQRNPQHRYSDSGRFDITLRVQSAEGCADSLTRSAYIHISEVFSCFIPNAFSPNSDGLNSTFGPETTGLDHYSMDIYNRWGELIFRTTTSQPWDGTYQGSPVPDGLYLYLIRAVDINKRFYNYNGWVKLMR